MHEIGLDKPGEGERTLDNFIGIVRRAQQQKGNEGNGNLNADGVLGVPEEVGRAWREPVRL